MQKKGVMFPLLDGILHGINDIDSGNSSLDDILDNAQIIPQEMRRTAAFWLFSIYRYRMDIEKYIRSFAAKKKIKKNLFNLALAGLGHCAFQNRISREAGVNAIVEYTKIKYGKSESGFINALLRKYCRENSVFSAHLPPFIAGKWQKTYGSEFIVTAEKCFSSEPEQIFRLRNGFTLEDVEAEKIESKIISHLQFCRTSNINQCIESECFRNGGIYIQDIATGVSTELLARYINKDKGKFIDVCGAPGGKAITFHDLCPDFELTIGDRSERRQQRTKENLIRCKVDAKLLCCDASSFDFQESFDAVFADVPCSNSGVFRKRPDALYRLNSAFLDEIKKIQYNILENICKYVAAGGLLLYSTCSIEAEENSLQIADFCARHKDFELLEERLTLPDIQHDGSYCACLRRRG